MLATLAAIGTWLGIFLVGLVLILLIAAAFPAVAGVVGLIGGLPVGVVATLAATAVYDHLSW